MSDAQYQSPPWRPLKFQVLLVGIAPLAGAALTLYRFTPGSSLVLMPAGWAYLCALGACWFLAFGAREN